MIRYQMAAISESEIEYFESIQKLLIANQKDNVSFIKAFSQTQIFAVFVDKITANKFKGVYDNLSYGNN